MDQVSSVMGADENIIEGLTAVCGKHKPELVGLPTTGLAETQGADIKGAVRQFRNRHPEFDAVAIVPVNTPDYCGCFESGFALAVRELIDVVVPDKRSMRPVVPPRSGRVVVLAGHCSPSATSRQSRNSWKPSDCNRSSFPIWPIRWTAT